MATRLTLHEKETIILTNEGDDIFRFETFNPSYKRKLAVFSEKHPAHCTLDRTRPEGSVRYIIDKKCLSFRFTAPYSEERRQKSREQAKKNSLTGSNGKRAS